MFESKIAQGLTNEIQTQRFKDIYERLHRQHPSLLQFPRPQDLLLFMHDKEAPGYEVKDDVLRILVREYQGPNGDPLGPYILILMQPALSRIYFEFLNKIAGMPWIEAEELESEVWQAGLAAARTLDINRCGRVAAKIKDRARSAVRKWFRAVKQSLKERPLEDAELIPAPDVPSTRPLEELIEKLVSHGVLSSSEAFLIVSSRIYGRKLTYLTRATGSSYAALQKKKHRAETKLKRHLEKLLRSDV